MKKYLNIGLFAHIDAGKSTLFERLLLETEQINSMGVIEEGTTESDFLIEEVNRGISIQSTVYRIELTRNNQEYCFQIIDNPGHIDFQKQISSTILAIDLAILILDGKEGVKSQTLFNLELLEKNEIPTIIFINKIDKVDLDLSDCVIPIQEYLKKDSILLFQKNGKKYEFIGTNINLYHREILQTFEWDELLSNEYLEEKLSLFELMDKGIAKSVWDRKKILFTVGSALTGFGMTELVQLLITLSIYKNIENQILEKKNKAQIALVFKKQIHPELGPIVFFSADKNIVKNKTYYFQNQSFEFLNFYYPQGQNYSEVSTIFAGDIFFSRINKNFLVGNRVMKTLEIGDRQESKNKSEQFSFYVNLETEKEIDKSEFLEAIQKTCWEDEGIEYFENSNTGQIRFSGMGELHLEVALSRLREFYKKKFLQSPLQVISKNFYFGETIKLELYHEAFRGERDSGTLTLISCSSGSFENEIKISENVDIKLKEVILSAIQEIIFIQNVVGVQIDVLEYKKVKSIDNLIINQNEIFSLIKVAIYKELKNVFLKYTKQIYPKTYLQIFVEIDSVGTVVQLLEKNFCHIVEINSNEKGFIEINGFLNTCNLIGLYGKLRNITKGMANLISKTIFDENNYCIN